MLVLYGAVTAHSAGSCSCMPEGLSSQQYDAHDLTRCWRLQLQDHTDWVVSAEEGKGAPLPAGHMKRGLFGRGWGSKSAKNSPEKKQKGKEGQAPKAKGKAKGKEAASGAASPIGEALGC